MFVICFQHSNKHFRQFFYTPSRTIQCSCPGRFILRLRSFSIAGFPIISIELRIYLTILQHLLIGFPPLVLSTAFSLASNAFISSSVFLIRISHSDVIQSHANAHSFQNKTYVFRFRTSNGNSELYARALGWRQQTIRNFCRSRNKCSPIVGFTTNDGTN